MSILFSPLTVRGIELPNRVVVSPMCTYQAREGAASDWHLAHYGRFALGGAGAVMVEATAVVPTGRITHGCLGLWSDDQIGPLRRIAALIRSQGSVPGIQLAHAGRKASCRLPWQGAAALGAEDAARGEPPWPTVAPSGIAANPTRPTPVALDEAAITELCQAWGAAARRAHAADFDVIEVHGAHGYLLHSFLSPISNRRADRYGGSLDARMSFPLAVAKAVRANWPKDRPVYYRLSAIDDLSGGWSLADSVAFARRLADGGVDVIDCSSGGIDAERTRTSATERSVPPGYQVPFSEAIRAQTGVRTLAVGLIVDARFAESVLQRKQADLIGMGREILFNPNWPLHAAVELDGDSAYARWPVSYRRAIERRAPWVAAQRDARRSQA